MESRLSKNHAYRPRKRMRPDPTPAKVSKAVASRYYQLRSGHTLIGPYLKKIGKRASDTCWWCDRGLERASGTRACQVLGRQETKNALVV